jgi:hypothetical protein
VVTVGAEGAELITTLTEADEVQPLAITVTEYAPLIPIVVFNLDGFCRLLVKPPGPVQLYDTPVDVVDEVRFNVDPEHNGLLLPAVGGTGELGLESVNGPTVLEVQPEVAIAILL